MKVVNPQSALLPTAEVYQFIQDRPQRKPDMKVGSYPSVNLHNYQIVRSDFKNYVTINHPHVVSCPPTETFMKDLIVKLKPYELTKAEVVTLLNLGVGLPSSKPVSSGDDEPRQEEDEEQQESELPRSLFRLVVEESEQRFEGDDGEAKIDQILTILGEVLQNSRGQLVTAVNGYHKTGEGKKVNGTSETQD